MVASVEHHPENGIAPFVVVIPMHDGGKMWFAYSTLEQAQIKLPMIMSEMARCDGLIELDHPKQCTYHG